ncbi:SOS response-associated peptidase [Verrucomicrobium sp. BvORR106]|uniref:SOS response-associated peptidase n=1 Tax=Verrucomicrobium sp. BvORR106 TaxID=1403819 RepID=UPI00056FDC59|nr:SOS response-associated peptidase [Verrucomicrobium sp. BvORR106]
MCGRFRYRGMTIESDELKHVPGLEIRKAFPPRFNIAPTQLSPIVRATKDGGHEVEALRWGLLPFWAKDQSFGAKTINARAETVPEKPAFRNAFRFRRCLVLSHGFFEWETTPTGKQPWLFTLPGESLMVFAGLWESWTPKDAPPETPPTETFSILTTTATTRGAWIHDRFPVVLAPEDWVHWMDDSISPQELERLVQKVQTGHAATEMNQWPVTRKMSNARYEAPDAVEPLSTQGKEGTDLLL